MDAVPPRGSGAAEAKAQEQGTGGPGRGWRREHSPKRDALVALLSAEPTITTAEVMARTPSSRAYVERTRRELCAQLRSG